MIRPTVFALSLILLLPVSVLASGIDSFEFDNNVQMQRYQSLVDNMRCPYCENQSLSGSDSPIANDLRRQVYDLIKDGRADTEIIDFMVERYGEYILYRPPLRLATLLLWFGPALLLVGGVVALLVMVHRRRRDALAQEELSADEVARLRELLQASGGERV